MKKVILLSALSIACIFMASAQKPKTTTPVKTQPTTTQKPVENAPAESEIQQKMVAHFATKYSLAVRWNDLDLAKDALYDLITEYPGSDSLIYALAFSYYENQKYTSSILIGKDLLQRTPKNPQVLELVAVSFEGLNISEKALENYESLYLITNRTETLYKMAFLQYDLKKYAEALINVDIVLGKPEAETMKLTFADAQGKQKDYAMKIAILNLKGLIYKDQGDKVNAKKYFEQAIAAAPDFAPAKENLTALTK